MHFKHKQYNLYYHHNLHNFEELIRIINRHFLKNNIHIRIHKEIHLHFKHKQYNLYYHHNLHNFEKLIRIINRYFLKNNIHIHTHKEFHLHFKHKQYNLYYHHNLHNFEELIHIINRHFLKNNIHIHAHKEFHSHFLYKLHTHLNLNNFDTKSPNKECTPPNHYINFIHSNYQAENPPLKKSHYTSYNFRIKDLHILRIKEHTNERNLPLHTRK